MNIREPGEGFVSMARQAVTVLVRGDPQIEQLQGQGAFICCPLSAEARKRCETTLYEFFARAQSTEARAVVVLEEADEAAAEPAYREAALGMMDNPVYR